MCLTRAWNEASPERTMEPLLSQSKGVGLDWICPRLSKSERSQMASLEASHAATYSDSHDEVDTVFCLWQDQEIRPEPREKQYPDMERRVSGQLAQKAEEPTDFH